MRPHTLILESQNYSPEALKLLQKLGPVETYEADSDDEEVYPETNLLVARLGYHINAEFLKRFPAVKMIASPTTGLNHIDLEYCMNHEIRVVSLKGETGFLQQITATAELTLGLLLSVVRQIPAGIRSVVSDHQWDRDAHRGRDLNGMTLGILGYGRLGRIVAGYGRALGMKVLASDIREPAAENEDRVSYCSQAELFKNCDIVSLHAGYSEANRHMVDGVDFDRMRTGSYFINTARGELVNEDALLDALESGKLAGAGLDVLDNEQDQAGLFKKPLIKYAQGHSNLLITPHIGGCTLESMHKTELFLARKIESIM